MCSYNVCVPHSPSFGTGERSSQETGRFVRAVCCFDFATHWEGPPGILQYVLGSGKDSDLMLNHKPSNPILGEIHKGRIDHPDGSHSYFLAEQVRHPLACYLCSSSWSTLVTLSFASRPSTTRPLQLLRSTTLRMAFAWLVTCSLEWCSTPTLLQLRLRVA